MGRARLLRKAGACVPAHASPMDALTLPLVGLNALSTGLLLFLLASGLTLTYSLMGVLNFAHGSFYLLGAYLAWSLTQALGLGWALLLAPVLVGALGVLVERWLLRRLRPAGHLPELLVTFGLGWILMESVPLFWGRQPLDLAVPEVLRGPWFTWAPAAQEVGVSGLPWQWSWGDGGGLCAGTASSALAGCVQFSRLRALGMAVSLGVLLVLSWVLWRTRLGLVVRAARSRPQVVAALGHDVPFAQGLVFGAGAALAALAGVVAAALRVVEPGMGQSIGALVFAVVVIGGLGSLAGALAASLLVGLLDAAAVAGGWALAGALPYLLLVAVLLWRPRGLLGKRDG